MWYFLLKGVYSMMVYSMLNAMQKRFDLFPVILSLVESIFWCCSLCAVLNYEYGSVRWNLYRNCLRDNAQWTITHSNIATESDRWGISQWNLRQVQKLTSARPTRRNRCSVFALSILNTDVGQGISKLLSTTKRGPMIVNFKLFWMFGITRPPLAEDGPSIHLHPLPSILAGLQCVEWLNGSGLNDNEQDDSNKNALFTQTDHFGSRDQQTKNRPSFRLTDTIPSRCFTQLHPSLPSLPPDYPVFPTLSSCM